MPITVSTPNINRVISQVNRYGKGLESRIRRFMVALADYGITVINPIVQQYRADERSNTLQWDSVSHTFIPNSGPTPDVSDATRGLLQRIGRDQYRLTVSVTGEDVLFMEFSTGITHGTAPGNFPHGVNNPNYGTGYGYGTYNPDSAYALSPDGWWYWDGHNSYHSFGNRAYMPMLQSSFAMERQIIDAARRAFE